MTYDPKPMSAESSRLPLWFPVLVGCGIALYFMQPAPTPALRYFGGMITATWGLWLGWGRWWLRLVFFAALAVMLGAMVSALRLEWVAAPVLRDPVFFKMVEGTVDDIQHKEKKTKLILQDVSVEGLAVAETPKRVTISLPNRGRAGVGASTLSPSNNAPLLSSPLMGEVIIGARIRLPATLFPPPSPTMPGAYDFARMFYFQQIGAVGFSPRQPEVIFPSQESGSITALRLSIADHLVAVMGAEAGAIASALMVGEQSRVPEEVSDSMRASGIYHILSISGLHMALATGMIFFISRLILVMIPHAALFWPNKKIAAVLGLLGGMAYLLLSGAPVPAIRSYIMVACVLVAILVDRKGISMFSLGWAAMLILLFMPESLFTASFQLSFAATLAIVALYERYGHLFFHTHATLWQRCFLYFFGLMLTSLAATLYTSPLAITHFNRMAIYGILANMLIVPLSSFWIMPMALLAFITLPLGWDALPLSGLKLGLEWMMAMSRFVSHVPHANLALPAPNGWGVLLIVLGGLWLALWITRWRWLGALMLLAGMATIALFKPYDVIISDDAKRVAYRSASGQWVMLRGEVDSFEAEQWARMQGVEAMLSRKEALARLSDVRCDETSCMVERGGKMLVVMISSSRRKSGSGENSEQDSGFRSNDTLCNSGADVMITSQFLSCDRIPHVIDRDFVETHGASGLRFTESVIELDTSQKHRGHWPWSNRKNE